MRKKIAIVFLLFMLNAALCSAASKNDINLCINNFDGNVGIYAQNLKTGKTFGYNRDVVFPTASTSKLVVALATYRYLYPKASAEEREKYDNYIKDMMITSDNDAFICLLSELGENDSNLLKKVIKDLKLSKTLIHSEEAFRKYDYHSVTTPYEMAKIMMTINNEKYLGRIKSRIMKDELANTIYNEEMPRFMLTKVMHKVGELDDVLCDVGIVDDGRDKILISIYTVTDRPVDYASDFIADMSALLYNYLRRK